MTSSLDLYPISRNAPDQAVSASGMRLAELTLDAVLGSVKKRATERGYVETMFGRRIYLPEINGGNGPRQGVVLMNAAAVLYVAGVASNWAEGITLARHVQERNIPVILVSGYADMVSNDNQLGVPMLAKPFSAKSRAASARMVARCCSNVEARGLAMTATVRRTSGRHDP